MGQKIPKSEGTLQFVFFFAIILSGSLSRKDAPRQDRSREQEDKNAFFTI